MFDQATDPRPHAVVIGAGFGGLAAAVRLGAKGWRVTIVDRLDQPGGRARVHREAGYVMDAGPTIVTAPYLFEELWALAGRRLADDVDLRPLDPFYRVRFDDGDVFDYSGDHDRMRAQVRRIAPDDVAGYDRFMAASAEIFQIAFAELADQPFHQVSTLLRSAPDLVRLGGFRSVFSRVGRYFRHPKLRLLFSFHPLLIGGNPLTTTAYYCLIAHLERTFGVHYAMGGMGSLAQGLAQLVEGQGGRLRFGAEVARVLTRDGRAAGVALASGEEIAADIVVSNADPGRLYGAMLGDHPRRRWTDARLARARWSMGLFVWHFGTTRRWDDVPHHTMALGPRYEELLRDIFERRRLADDFSLYLHRPSATDPTLAPPGGDCFYALSPVPNLTGGVDWAARAESYRQAIERRLEETLLPGLSQAIAVSRVMTPQGFQDELLSVAGAGFSLEPRLLQSAWFRPHNVSEELPGLFLVGAGTHPGAGIPGVLSSAKVVEKVVPDAAAVRPRVA